MKRIYVLISKTYRAHYGAYADEQTARENASKFEALDNLKTGDIDIYEIPERWFFDFKIS